MSFEIILVDNASVDDSCAYLRRLFPDIRIICNEKNLGFAKANNQGINISQGKHILLLNSDTLVSSNTLDLIFNFIEQQPDVGILGCKVLNRDGSLQFSCYRDHSMLTEILFFTKGIFKSFWDPFIFYQFMKYWNHNVGRDVDCIAGCFLWVRKEVFDICGGLDERFFMYYEEAEFCCRVRKMTKFRVHYWPYVSIIHLHGASSERSNYYSLKTCFKSANLYFSILKSDRFAALFKSICFLVWKLERLCLMPFGFFAKVKKKLDMIDYLMKE